MLIVRLAVEAAEAAHPITPAALTAAGIAFAVFLTLGIITWSYRDVYNRHNDKTGADAGHDSHSAGH
jgi:hypothetical protein